MKLTDLTSLRQRNDESVSAFIQRFRDIKNQCYSLVLSDHQLADVAFQGLLPHIKEKYASQEFDSISQMVHRMTGEVRPYEQKRNNFQKKVNFAESADSPDSDEEEVRFNFKKFREEDMHNPEFYVGQVFSSMTC